MGAKFVSGSRAERLERGERLRSVRGVAGGGGADGDPRGLGLGFREKQPLDDLLRAVRAPHSASVLAKSDDGRFLHAERAALCRKILLVRLRAGEETRRREQRLSLSFRQRALRGEPLQGAGAQVLEQVVSLQAFVDLQRAGR